MHLFISGQFFIHALYMCFTFAHYQSISQHYYKWIVA